MQGRQDLNLQPTVLETVALPIELRPYALQCSAAGITIPEYLGLVENVTKDSFNDIRVCAKKHRTGVSELTPVCGVISLRIFRGSDGEN